MTVARASPLLPARPGRVLLVAVAAGLALSVCRAASEEPARTEALGAGRHVVDMRGVRVAIPAGLSRVATIDDGFVEGVMTHLGVISKVVAVGSWSLRREFRYRFPLPSGASSEYTQGMNTMLALHPWLRDRPCVTPPEGDVISYESLVNARPDLVILRVGDCAVGTNPDVVAGTTRVIESLGLPVVVLHAPSSVRDTGLDTMRDELRVLGEVFQQARAARDLAAYLESLDDLVRSRTRGIAESERPAALYLGLAAGARQAGGAGYAWGVDTAESYILEHLVGARNAYRGAGSRVLLSAEQLLALDPDVIFLPTSAGYHPPEELYEAPDFRLLRDLRAVRERRVYALAWAPDNCARRLEYPIDMLIMAKGVYPERFRDIRVHQWVLRFYQRLYGADGETAEMLRSRQWLDWMVRTTF